jgi:hypothetical protein
MKGWNSITALLELKFGRGRGRGTDSLNLGHSSSCPSWGHNSSCPSWGYGKSRVCTKTRAHLTLWEKGSAAMPKRAWAYGKGWPWTPWSLTQARHALPFYALQAHCPWNNLTAVTGVTSTQGRRPAAVFYPSGHPTRYAYLKQQRAKWMAGKTKYVAR